MVGGRWTEWQVRTGVEADAQAIGALHVRSWRHSYRGIVADPVLAGLDPRHSAERWTEHLRAARYTVSLAVDPDDAALGAFCAVGPVRDEARDGRPGASTGELYALYTDPPALGRGAGPAAHGAGVARLRAAGYRHAVLWVLTGNPRARAFYARHGWRCDELVEREEHDGVPLPVVRYSRALAPPG
jgi:GNAT superfamily N-acetyltransferase